MDLFNNSPDTNLLPDGGTVLYYPAVLSITEANHYFDLLFEKIQWKNDEAVIYGKKIITPRKVAWYGDAPYSYTYSNITKMALPWTDELLLLKAITEKVSGSAFNSCLMNLYHNGKEGMTWHSDDERSLARNAPIGCMSLGAERKFSFKHKRSGEKIPVILGNGSVFVMKDDTQSNWLHRLPPTAKVTRPRISLTFRTIAQSLTDQASKA
jgi:alkylated DNA repair dioxygenase AlkB